LEFLFSCKRTLKKNLWIKKNVFRENFNHSLEIAGFCFVDIGMTEDVQAGGARSPERFAEVEQLVSLLNGRCKMKGGMALWWQQLCAVTRLRFLKLKHERKSIVIL
jgi:hypothetical protein